MTTEEESPMQDESSPLDTRHGGELETLTADDSARLAELETAIQRGLETFVEVGRALAEIRRRHLYRESHSTFEDYCRERWDFSDSRAHQLIGTNETVTTVTAAGLPPPANERQARALASLDDEKKVEVWGGLLDEHGAPDRLTAEVIAEKVKGSP